MAERTKTPVPSRGPERFAMAVIGDEGVVLDVATGEIYGADAASVLVFRALLRGEGERGAVLALTRAFDTGRERAQRDVRRILGSLRSAPRRRRPGEVIRLAASARGGYDLFLEGARAAWLDASGRLVERDPGAPRASSALRLAAPHVLMMRGRSVLHASAVMSRRGIVAFVGPSGIGKSTLASRLARRLPVIADDLLVLAGSQRAVLDGERVIRAWSRARARVVSTDTLVACASGERSPLRAVLVVERARGRETLAVEPLRGVEAIAALFTNAFVELPSARVWRRALAHCHALAARRLVLRLRVPDGLGALDRALGRPSDSDDPIEALLGPRGRAHPRMTDSA